MTQPVLEVTSISKQFESVRAVSEVSFEVHRGEILGYLGPNGAGKTTSIRMILGIFQPDEGEIRVHIGAHSGRLLKERTGYLPEERGLYADATVLDALTYFAELKGIRRDEARRRVTKWLGRFDLLEWQHRKVEKLSKGMQQKVQFVAAVAHEPDLLVLDEPFSGLDPVHQDLLKDVIRELRDRGAAIMLSAHQMNQVEELCDRIFLIHRGRPVLYGNLDEIKAAHGEHVVRLRFDGAAEGLANLPGVAELSIQGDRASLRLERNASPDAFVRSLPAALTIREIVVTRPPLHDIFVRTIERENDEAA
jgi:ABC-2 type transport system ATP-binding protein